MPHLHRTRSAVCKGIVGDQCCRDWRECVFSFVIKRRAFRRLSAIGTYRKHRYAKCRVSTDAKTCMRVNADIAQIFAVVNTLETVNERAARYGVATAIEDNLGCASISFVFIAKSSVTDSPSRRSK